MIIETKFIKLLYEKDDFAIFLSHDEQIFKGVISYEAETLLNVPLKIEYEEVFHEKYGKQKVIKSVEVLQDPLEFFFKKIIRTVPKKTINEIFEKYTKEEITYILENEPERLLEFNQIGEKRLKKIIEKYQNYKHLLALIEYLAPFDISVNMINKIYETFKENSIKIIENNPYALTEIQGVGFKRADEIALKLGIEEKSEIRIKSAIKYYIKHTFDTTGDTVISVEEVQNKIKEDLGLDVEVKSYVPSIESVKVFNIEDKEFLTLDFIEYREKYIYSVFNQNESNWKLDIDLKEVEEYISRVKKRNGIKFSEKQKKAVMEYTTTSSPIFILGGYAGSGKTTISKTIMDIYAKHFGRKEIVACSLSGNASNRIKTVTGYNAYTIHSLLGFNGKEFLYNKDNPLPYTLIVLDEASMVDVSLFYTLLKAIDFKKSKLFIIGDNAQLLPIGYGEPFNDILEKSTVPKIILDKVYRQSEKQVINIFAQEIRKGKAPKNFNGRYEDYYFLDISIPYQELIRYSDKEKAQKRKELNEKILETILKLYEQSHEKMEEKKTALLEKPDFSVKEIYKLQNEYTQVLAPKRDGILGIQNLNHKIKMRVNPITKKEIEKGEFVGDKERFATTNDKVIHLRNINKRVMSFNDFLQLGMHGNILFDINDYTDYLKENRVFNGQIGTIIKIYPDEDEAVFAVYYPNEDYIVFYKEEEFINRTVNLSYAITIHKAQGSEYQNVFIPITLSNFGMYNNKLLYTAITRAKNHLCLIGEPYAFKKGCEKVDEIKRKTVYKFLKD